MTVDFRNNERRRFVNDLQTREKEIAAVLKVSSPSSPKNQQQLNDKRVRREIANGNERRRMQCINAGFTSLRALIPHLEGEKLSKAAILQQSIDHITALEKDKSRLQMKLDRTTRLLTELGQQDHLPLDPFVASTPPPSKRKKRDTESSDEGMGSLSDASDDCGIDLRQKNEALKMQADRERQKADSLEEENKSLRNLIYLIQKQQQSAREQQQPITLVTATVPQETHVREVVEVISPRLNYTPPHHQDEILEYSLPIHASSFPLENTIAMVACTAPQVNTSQVVEPVTVVSNVKLELQDNPSVGFLSTPPPSHCTMTSPSSNENKNTTISTVPTSETTHSSSDSSFLHNYAHRDHPRRRRHQAQLERQRIEEEERQQQEQEELQLRLQQQQQQLPLATTTTTAYIPRPQHSVRSLDILAEAANHVKDDSSNRLYQEDKSLQQSGQTVLYHSPDEKASRLGNHLELKLDSTGSLSPLQSTNTVHTAYSHHIAGQNFGSHVPIIVTTATTESANSSSSSSSFSEKYPIATHLLHRPLHTPFTRPGVIVQKH